MVRYGLSLLAGLSCLGFWSAIAKAEEKPAVDFARDVLPLMKAHCFKCHDAKKSRAGLRLDVRDLALRGGESGKAVIIPSDPDKSELIHRITSPDEETGMPPGKEKLSANQVKMLRDWIKSGATWPDALAGDPADQKRWAFKAPKRPELTAVKNKEWIRNPIDAFVLSRLEKEGLKLSAEADRVTLIRRLSLDLIGLPPTLEEVDAFLADKSPNAYEKVVDRLLASPHYGERWGRHWLDAARYADSDGFEKDKSRQVWFYRDWVINALNRDLPYNQFIIEQIAGDLLPNATQDQRVATGYLRNSMINEEGGIDPEQFRMEQMFDRMDAIGKGVLGLTIQCAQCHNHKFDPLSQAEYYKLFAFLNSDHEANIVVYTPEEQMKRADLFGKIHEIETDLRHRAPEWRKRMHEWEEIAKKNQPDWKVLRPEVVGETTGGQKYLPLEDGSFLAQGYAPTQHTAQMKVRTDVKKITAFRLELLNDANLPLGGPGRSIWGTGALTEFRVEEAPADAPDKKSWVKFVKATADINPPETPLEVIFDNKSGKRRVYGPVQFAIDGRNETAWGIDTDPGRRNQPRKAVFLAEKPIDNPKGTILTFHIAQDHGGWNSDDNQNNNLGRLRLSLTTQLGAEADPLPANVRQILLIPADKRSPAQEGAVFSYWRTTVAEWKEANERIEKLWKQHPVGTSQLAFINRDKPRETHILKRGDFLKPTDAVAPGVPAFLHPLPKDAPLTRLTFARWLVDPKSPTTARAFVNRVWQNYLGTGLSATSEDLGTQSEYPSHPELLDWLVVEFMEKGWSQKSLHRLIVNSATYRQSSKVTPELQSKDPYNRLLARASRVRVEAEVVRDVALSASGLLNPKVGGRSVFPPLPDFLFQPPTSYGPKIWPEDKGPDRYRRSLYTFRYRSVPNPVLQSFDAPNGDFACVRRARSNTPLQALITLNEPISMDCSRALALKAAKEGGEKDIDRLTYAFRRVLSRSPTDNEAKVLLDLLSKENTRFAKHDAKPIELAFGSPEEMSHMPNDMTLAQLAAWTAVSRVLLNLDETITKE